MIETLQSPMDPDAQGIPHFADWTAYLDQGETITQSVWAVDQGAATLSGELVGGSITQVAVSNPSPPFVVLRNRITTSAGRTDDRSMRIVVAQT